MRLLLSTSHAHPPPPPTHTEATSEADLKRLKLCYTDPHFKSNEAEATEAWNRILTEQNQSEVVILKALIQGNVMFTLDVVLIDVTTLYQIPTLTHLHPPPIISRTGVPPKRRAEVWQFLSSQYREKSSVEYEFEPSLGTREGFMQLCKERTKYEHNIYVDIGECHMTIMHIVHDHAKFSGNC